MTDKALKEIIKDGVKEALKEERLTLYEIIVPYASKKEIDEINKKFGSPGKYKRKDFVDMTNWTIK